MKSIVQWVGVLAAVCVAGMSTPARAQCNVGFGPNLVGEIDRSAIPANPGLESWRLTTKGSAAPLGKFHYVSELRVHFGVDGLPLSITDGVGAFTGEHGDALFFTLSGIVQPNTDAKNPTLYPFEATYIITGGTGQYAYAVGSGRIVGTVDPNKGEFVGNWGPAKPRNG